MYTVKKTLEVAVSHKLNLDYDSPCTQLHGHNLRITIYCERSILDKNGMVVDFKQIKEKVHNILDHKYLNDLFDFNPTAENIAKWVTDVVPYCVRCDVEESSNNVATYEK